MLDTKKKQSLIKKYATHDGDTGSSEVQIAILTAEIDELIKHLKLHPKDHSSRRGLLRKVSARRRLMRYLKKENPESYEELAKKLKIKQPRLAKNPRQAGEDKEDEPVEEEALIATEDETDSE
jgi:small subunit ribosomal protein S15